ncbi:MAG: hypothetical protein ACYCO9_23040 [Streptosporangiaceae bacterium]
MSADVIDGASPPRVSDPEPGRPGWPGRRWRLGIGLGAAVALVAALITAAVAAARYQPIRFGGAYRGPAGPHLTTRQVGNLYGLDGQSVLAPQPQAHANILLSLDNVGPLPVAIERLSFMPPSALHGATLDGLPFRISGRVTYTLEAIPHGVTPPGPRPLAGAVLQPGQDITIRVPIVTARCWIPNTRTTVAGFWVTSRSLLWTHHVYVSWTAPGSPTQGAVVSAEGYPGGNEPGLVCPR